MDWPKKLPPELEYGFDPTDPEAPGTGDGLPLIRYTFYDCIELCGDDHPAGLLLFKMGFYCRRATLTIDGKRWYVRGRDNLCRETRLTRHQYDRALKALKESELVETRRLPLSKAHIFGNYTAFRITLKAIDGLKGVRNLRGPVGSKKAAK